MIKSTDDVLKFYAAREKQFGAFGGGILKRRSSPLLGLQETVRNLGLPKGYSDFAEDFAMENVSLGFFELIPFGSSDLCNALEVLNGEQRNPKLPQCLRQVAAFEADIVAVSKGQPYHDDGAVFIVDITSSPDTQIVKIADSFENFIILASELDRTIIENIDDPEAAISSLLSAMKLGDLMPSWAKITHMVL